MPRAPDDNRARAPGLGGVALASFALLVAGAVLAFLGRAPASPFAGGATRLAVYGGFLFFDLIAIAAGIALAAMRRSLAWALLPAAAIVITFAMLFPAFEAFQAVRG